MCSYFWFIPFRVFVFFYIYLPFHVFPTFHVFLRYFCSLVCMKCTMFCLWSTKCLSSGRRLYFSRTRLKCI